MSLKHGGGMMFERRVCVGAAYQPSTCRPRHRFRSTRAAGGHVPPVRRSVRMALQRLFIGVDNSGTLAFGHRQHGTQGHRPKPRR